MTPNTIVRTFTGDGTGGGLDLDPNQVINEIPPWYAIKSDILIEIGNEPNIVPKEYSLSDEDRFGWRFNLNVAIDACRQEFPNARIISPGFATSIEGENIEEANVRRWFEIGTTLDVDGINVMGKCDYIGFHAYAFTDWYGGPDLQTIIPLMSEFFADKPWALTEYGINAPDIPDSEKGQRYANFIQNGQSDPPLPTNVQMATYFHVDSLAPNDPNDDFFRYYIYPDGDDGYRSITG